MKKNIKRIVSCALMLAVLVSSITVVNPTKSYAASTKDTGVRTSTAYSQHGEAKITTDNAKQRIAEQIDSNYKYVAVFDKTKNVITLTKTDKETGQVLDTMITDLNAKTVSTNTNDQISVLAASTYQNTFSNYEYTKWYGSPNKWELRRPADKGINNVKYFQTYETTKNATYLSAYYKNVNSINSLEGKCLTYMTTEVLIGVIGAIFSGGLAAFIAASTMSGLATSAAYDLEAECNNALDNYWNAYYKSTIL